MGRGWVGGGVRKKNQINGRLGVKTRPRWRKKKKKKKKIEEKQIRVSLAALSDLIPLYGLMGTSTLLAVFLAFCFLCAHHPPPPNPVGLLTSNKDGPSVMRTLVLAHTKHVPPESVERKCTSLTYWIFGRIQVNYERILVFFFFFFSEKNR